MLGSNNKGIMEEKDKSTKETKEALRLMRKMPNASQEERQWLLQRVAHHHGKANSHIMDEALEALMRGDISIDEINDLAS